MFIVFSNTNWKRKHFLCRIGWTLPRKSRSRSEVSLLLFVCFISGGLESFRSGVRIYTEKCLPPDCCQWHQLWAQRVRAAGWPRPQGLSSPSPSSWPTGWGDRRDGAMAPFSTPAPGRARQNVFHSHPSCPVPSLCHGNFLYLLSILPHNEHTWLLRLVAHELALLENYLTFAEMQKPEVWH